MTTIPPTPDQLNALYRGNPLIGIAEQAIRAFYVTTRADAARLLPMWFIPPEQMPPRGTVRRGDHERAGGAR